MSIFSMVVLEKPLKKVHEEIDLVTTPTGAPVAMVHCNNCTNDTNAWVNVLGETVKLFGAVPDTGVFYTRLYEKSLEGDPDCGGVLVCNYLAGEGVTHMDVGRPLVVRTPEARFTLANFFRAQLYSTMSTLKIGMDILAREGVVIDSLTAHGDQEHGFIGARLRKPRKIIAGYWKDENVRARLGRWMKAAVGVAVSRSMKVMRFGAHMLEVCPCCAAQRPRIETHHLGIGMNEKDPARLVFEGKPGDAIVVSLIDMGGRLRLICQDIHCVKPILPMPNLPVARIMWQAEPSLTTGVE